MIKTYKNNRHTITAIYSAIYLNLFSAFNDHYHRKTKLLRRVLDLNRFHRTNHRHRHDHDIDSLLAIV